MPILSIFTGIIAGLIAGPIIVLSFTFITFYKVLEVIKLIGFIKYLLDFSTKILIKIAEFGEKMPLNKIYIVTPNFLEILLYYSAVCILLIAYILHKKRRDTVFTKRIKNLYQLLKFRINQNKRKIISKILIFILIFNIYILIPKNLKIHFIDVGQGDSTLIITPKNKTILIDGGGNADYNVGKNILLPYLLDRRIKTIDYVLISHFDTDHSQSYAKILSELTASRIFITEQIEENDLFKQIMAIAKEKNIKVTYVKAGDIINIDGVKFSILHPQKELITNNGMNNNSMVCKLEYKSFSMLFTGDIEKEAEELILRKNTNLKADVLKVAHHRFKNFNNGRIFKSSIS